MGYDNENAEQVVIDIETVASPDAERLLDQVRAPSNYKDPDKIAAYQQEKLAEIIQRAALEPDLCEVVALGYQRPGWPVDVATRHECSEISLLQWFWNAVEFRRLIGFNILAFDLPVLIRRSQLLNVKHPLINLDRYRTGNIDLLERLSFNGKITYRSLAFYCRRFDIECEDTVAGADIPGLVTAGDWAAIHRHCSSDIQKTAQLAQRLGWFSTAEVIA